MCLFKKRKEGIVTFKQAYFGNAQQMHLHALTLKYLVVSFNYALTVASFRSFCCTEGELSPSRINAGAVKHGPDITETSTQKLESNMRCIYQTQQYGN